MPIGNILHAIHDIAEYDKFIKGVFNSHQENYYYHTAKRKRKTNFPQKRGISGDELDNDGSSGHSLDTTEPINLISKDTTNCNARNDKSEVMKENLDIGCKDYIEQNRICNALINYLLMKYHPHVLALRSLSDQHERERTHLDDDVRMSATAAAVSALSSERTSATRSPPLGFDYLNSGIYTHQCRNDTVGCIHPNRCAQYLDTSCKHSITYAINTCVHSIPVPKTGIANYENMVAFYRSLIDKAYSLQQAIEQYINQFQSSISSCPNSSTSQTTLCTSESDIETPLNHTSFQQSTPRPALSNLKHCLYDNSNDTDSLSDELHKEISGISNYIKSDSSSQRNMFTLGFMGQHVDSTYKIDESASFPVDLTKSENHDNLRFHENNVNAKEMEMGIRMSNSVGMEIQSKNKSDLMPSVSQSKLFEGCRSPYLDKHRIVLAGAKLDEGQFASKNCNDNSTASNSSLITLHQRKKSYFKAKRIKKHFANGTTTHVDTESQDGAHAKKSNFRGTSEEENKVSPEFRPVEVNGQIILSETHPSVTISKDIFYSLIVKSSGSATRLIRLLMKSFFTQDELAASSLSGEGIYKQRLKPSVTEAIKTFIRRRHPQLKTGSINLCMTDVCVQARRVANNQRTRQHPLRLVTQTSANATPNYYKSENINPELIRRDSMSLLGLKSRSLEMKRPTSVSYQSNSVDELALNDPRSLNWALASRQQGSPVEPNQCASSFISNESPQVQTEGQSSDSFMEIHIAHSSGSPNSQTTSFVAVEK